MGVMAGRGGPRGAPKDFFCVFPCMNLYYGPDWWPN